MHPALPALPVPVSRADPTPSSRGLDDEISSNDSDGDRDPGGYDSGGYDAEHLEGGYASTTTNGHGDDGLERIDGGSSNGDGEGAPRTAGVGSPKERGGEGSRGTMERGEPDEGGGDTTAVAGAGGDHGR